MDYSQISFDSSWSDNKSKMEEESKKAMAYAGIFAFTSSCLIIGIVRTIATNPGNIPEHKEWDMSTDTSGGEESASMMANQ